MPRLLLGYVQATIINNSQLIACNSRHCLSQRLARWLLVAKDRLNSNEIALTHRAMAQALEVRRAGITKAIGEMEHARIIQQRRGEIIVADEERPQEVSCDCYRVTRTAHERVLSAASSTIVKQRARHVT